MVAQEMASVCVAAEGLASGNQEGVVGSLPGPSLVFVTGGFVWYRSIGHQCPLIVLLYYPPPPPPHPRAVQWRWGFGDCP